VENILFTNEELFKDLKKEFQKYPSSPNVGFVFKKMAPFLKVYTQYITNFDTAAAEIERQEKKNKKFSEFLEKTYSSPECPNGQRILSFLILPVQRIPRYQLLLRVRRRFHSKIKRIYWKELQKNIKIMFTLSKVSVQLQKLLNSVMKEKEEMRTQPFS
jgi:hypothetical protein